MEVGISLHEGNTGGTTIYGLIVWAVSGCRYLNRLYPKMTKSTAKNNKLYAQRLRRIREAVRFDLPAMAQSLGLPYNTYRSYEYGHRPVPPDVLDRAIDLQKADRAFFRRLKKEINQKIEQDFPFGIA